MSEWKYDIDEVGEDADSNGDASADADGDAGPLANAESAVDDEFDPAEVEPEPIEPGSPTLENAFFVALGVATTLFVFAQVILLAGA